MFRSGVETERWCLDMGRWGHQDAHRSQPPRSINEHTHVTPCLFFSRTPAGLAHCYLIHPTMHLQVEYYNY